MSVYLYNLAFSLVTSDTAVGRFQQYNAALPNPTIANQSSAWFSYLLTGTPGNLGDYFQTVSSQVNPSQWGNGVSDSGSLSLEPGDYLAMRIFSTDTNVGQYQARVTGVFGQGTSEAPTDTPETLQSPLCMSTPTTISGYPRAVIDVDGSATSTWPGPVTGPLTADGSWNNWLGMAHTTADEGANDYTINIGVSVVYNGTIYTFGKDPRMKVGPGMLHRHKHGCEDAA
jgi:hypothetical protein